MAKVLSKIKENWVTVVVPFLIMWGAWMTLNVATMASSKDMDTVLHKRISKTKIEVKAKIKDEIAHLDTHIKDRDQRIRDLEHTVSLLQNKLLGECPTGKLDDHGLF